MSVTSTAARISTNSGSTPAARRLAQAAREVSRRVNSGLDLGGWEARLDRATERAVDTVVSTNRAYHFRDLALAGHGEVVVEYLATR